MVHDILEWMSCESFELSHAKSLGEVTFLALQLDVKVRDWFYGKRNFLESFFFFSSAEFS